MGRNEADRGDEVVAKAVLVVANEGEDEDMPMLLQGVFPAREVVAVEGEER